MDQRNRTVSTQGINIMVGHNGEPDHCAPCLAFHDSMAQEPGAAHTRRNLTSGFFVSEAASRVALAEFYFDSPGRSQLEAMRDAVRVAGAVDAEAGER